MSQHTPAPWRVDATVALGPMGIYSDSSEVEQELSHICSFTYARNRVNGKNAQTREQIEANAILIAAAPDLLAALVRLLHETDDGQSLCSREVAEDAHAAIRKAKGEEPA